MTILSIDRLEEEYAVCTAEDRSTVLIPLAELPKHCKEGDCLCLLPEGGYVIDPEVTRQRREEILALTQKLFRKPKP